MTMLLVLAAAALQLPLPTAERSVRFSYCPGECRAKASLVFLGDGKKTATWSLRSFDQDFKRRKEGKEEFLDNGVPVFSKTARKEGAKIEDSGISVSGGRQGPNVRIHSKARVQGRYTDKQIDDIFAHPEKYGEPAKDHAFLFEFRRGADGGCELWEGGSFVGPFPAGRVDAVRLETGGAAKAVRLPDGAENADPLKLDLAVPKPFDTSVCKVNLGSYLLECDGYLSREPHDALPDSFLRRVPAATYSGALVHCRVDDAANATCLLTARMTNFHCPSNEGRSPEAITQETKELPHRDGEYDVVFSLDPGKIQDLVHDNKDRFLDFELLGGLEPGGSSQAKNRYKPDGKRSGVTVLGVTLVRSPASLHVANGAYGNVFVAGETACVTARVVAAKAGNYKLAWRVSDLDGKVIERQATNLALAEGQEWRKTLAFGGMCVGWYRLEVVLADNAGNRLVRFPDGAFVVIAKDGRKAGYESPYFTWNRIGRMDTNGFRQVGAYLKKLGIRRTQLKKYTEEDAKEFGLTLGEGHWCGAKGATQAEKEADYERQVREMLARWPHISSALIFHEKSGGPQPQELVGGVTELDAAQKARQKELVDEAAWHARIWRKVAPRVELKVGNASSSLPILGSLFRGGYPKELIDTMGEERVGQQMSPERCTGEGFRNLKDLAEMYGYANGPAACYEWKSHVRRNFFGNLRKHAAWYVRDCLIALAWGSRQVTVPSGPEIGNSYFNTCWGGGALTRSPLLQPFPLVAAVANLTRTLDRCMFSRLVPTGSKSVYLVEFRNPEGCPVYAGWAARGIVETKIETRAKEACVVDLFGRETTCAMAAKFTVRLSEEPTYLKLDGPIVRADATAPRTYPWETYAGQERRSVLASLNKVADVELVAESDPRFAVGKTSLQWLRQGNFDLKEVREDGKPCLSLAVRTDKPVTPRVYEYGFLKLRKPVAVPEGAKTIGLEVRGNSSWGKLVFEIEDAKGRKFITLGQGADYYDMSDTMSLNYDGWHFLQFMVRPDSPALVASIGMNMKQWRGWKPDRPFAYPVKVTGIGFLARRYGFDLMEWVRPDSDEIRFRNLSAY